MTLWLWTTLWVAGALPPWLELHPAAKPNLADSPGMIEASYVLPAKPAEAVEHFTTLFAKAKLAFSPAADGIGISARVAAPECDLLLQFHPAAAGTTVRIYCTAKTPAPAASAAYPPLTPAKPYRAQWVSTAPARNSAGPSAAHPHAEQNNAPPLQWPSWLQLIGANQTLRPEHTNVSGMRCLRASYLVDPSQRKPLIFAYRDLLQSYGFRIDRVEFSTGNTITGQVVEDFRGFVEGFQSGDGSYGAAATIVKASFSRQGTIRDPGTMAISVCVRGSTR